MSSKSVSPERCAIVSSKGVLEKCHLSVWTQGVSQVSLLEMWQISIVSVCQHTSRHSGSWASSCFFGLQLSSYLAVCIVLRPMAASTISSSCAIMLIMFIITVAGGGLYIILFPPLQPLWVLVHLPFVSLLLKWRLSSPRVMFLERVNLDLQWQQCDSWDCPLQLG